MLQNQLLFLVDDDLDDHEIFKSALEKVDEDVELISAIDGLEALHMLAAANILPDYIFVDLNMPGMGGYQFLKEIKRTENLRNIPVIIYTTSSNPIDMAKTKEMGAVSFITKPSRFAELCNLLRSLISGQSTTSMQML